MKATAIVFRKEMIEILRDRRTLIAIALAALASPVVLYVISQVSTRTASETYTVGYSGDIPTGLDVLFSSTGLKLEPVADPQTAAKQQVDLGVVFGPHGLDEYYDPTRQSAQIADIRVQEILSRYDAAKVAASLQQQGVDPSVLNPLPVSVHPLSSPAKAAGNGFLSFFLPYILITMSLTGGLSAALDTSAGERERKTLESLLLTPAPRAHVLVGKTLAVATISLAAALPAIAFSSLTIALGTLARNFRQGQAYATPLYFVTIFPASIVLFIPDFNPNLGYYLIPILNAVLVLRDAIVHDTVALSSLAVTSASLLVTGGLCFYAALRLFTREALLVRS